MKMRKNLYLFLHSLLKVMKPKDWIALSVIGTATFLIWSGANGTVGGLLLMVVSYYFGGEVSNGAGLNIGVLHKKANKRPDP